MLSKFKEFYQSKRGKSICFFGFYFIFFLVLALMLKNNNSIINKNQESKTLDKEISLKNLMNNNYQYRIVIEEESNQTIYQGRKDNVDYQNSSYRYFLDIYNLNQLIKKSKLMKVENNIYIYQLENKVLNEILLTDKKDGFNEIKVYTKDSNIEKISLDLKNYFEKEKMVITINYQVGDESE